MAVQFLGGVRVNLADTNHLLQDGLAAHVQDDGGRVGREKGALGGEKREGKISLCQYENKILGTITTQGKNRKPTSIPQPYGSREMWGGETYEKFPNRAHAPTQPLAHLL